MRTSKVVKSDTEHNHLASLGLSTQGLKIELCGLEIVLNFRNTGIYKISEKSLISSAAFSNAENILLEISCSNQI